MNQRIKQSLYLVGIAVVANLVATFLFHRLDVVRGYFDQRSEQMGTANAWILGILTLLGCWRPQLAPVTLGYITGTMFYLAFLGIFVLFYPLNPAESFLFMLLFGLLGAILGGCMAKRTAKPPENLS